MNRNDLKECGLTLLPRNITQKRITVGGITFIQAVYPRTQYPAFTEHGHPIFAVPGGGYATKEHLQKVLEEK